MQAAVGSPEVFPGVGAAVRSSYEVLYHQAHVNDRKTVTYGKRSLYKRTDTVNTHILYRVLYGCYSKKKKSVSITPIVYINATQLNILCKSQ